MSGARQHERRGGHERSAPSRSGAGGQGDDRIWPPDLGMSPGSLAEATVSSGEATISSSEAAALNVLAADSEFPHDRVQSRPVQSKAGSRRRDDASALPQRPDDVLAFHLFERARATRGQGGISYFVEGSA